MAVAFPGSGAFDLWLAEAPSYTARYSRILRHRTRSGAGGAVGGFEGGGDASVAAS